MTQGADPLVSIAHPGFGHRDLLGGVHALAHAPDGPVSDKARAEHVYSHIGQVVLNGLEASDGPTKLLSLLRVLQGHLQNPLGPADHLGTLGGGPPLVYRPCDGPTLFLPAEDFLLRYADVLESHLLLVVGADGLQRFKGDARLPSIHQKQRDAVLAGAACAGHHQQVVSHMGVRDEQLRAV